jgi:kumamolisin
MTDTYKYIARPSDLRKVNAAPQTIYVPGYLTPPQIANAYNIPASTGTNIKIGIISYGGGFQQSDLNSTFADFVNYGLLPVGTTAPTISQILVEGATGEFGVDGDGDFENTLDIYCVATMVPNADITIYIGINNALSSQLQAPISRAIADGCHIITMSWGFSDHIGGFWNAIFTTAINAADTNKIAMCVSSGDFGSTQGDNVLDTGYPSSDRKVLSIGGTKLILNTVDERLTETDDNRDSSFGASWGGGGGVNRRPVYVDGVQQSSVPSWQSGLYYTPIVDGIIGNPTPLDGRGLPDISAPMNSYAFYFEGALVGAGGTSASAPFIAGMLARIQAITGKQRSSAEYNALFYSHKNSFFDITVGTNNTQITSGYAGTVDWDPVTGLGPPIGNKVFQYMRNGLRPTSGGVFPNHKFDRRPTTGMVWPRTKTL